jgi:cephalosporin hydroxylase
MAGRAIDLAAHDRQLLRKKVSERQALRPIRNRYRHIYRMSLWQWLIRHQEEIVFDESTWMGVRALKNPMDAWIYQEILAAVRPQVVVEIGSMYGGSTLYYAHLMDLLGAGEEDGMIISVDIDHSKFEAKHRRIRTITGDSKSPAVVEQVAALCAGRTALVIHDGDHRAEAVLADLRLYQQFVTPGSYLIVEDGNQDIFRPGDGIGARGGGPLLASEHFLLEYPAFTVDASRERYLLTYNPRGFLKRTR